MSSILTDSRVLITGGAGFVGSFIAEQLLAKGVREIVIIDNLIRGSLNNIKEVMSSKKATFIEGDIRDILLLEKAFKDIDYCFHMAALRITHCIESPKDAVEVMINGTFNVADACVKHKVKKLVAASSASVYGAADTFPTREDHHPYNNRTLYGAAKMADELMLRAFNSMYGLDYNAMRYFNIYGPRMDIHGKYTEVLIRWYDAIRSGRRPLIYGDGKQTMDFIYVEEVARSTILAMNMPYSDEVFNIASGRETSLEGLCSLLLKVMKSDLKPEYVPISDTRKKVEVIRRLADITKAKKDLSFQSKISLEEGLGRLVSWLDQERKEAKV